MGAWAENLPYIFQITFLPAIRVDGRIPMDVLLQVDLDWLCIAAEIAAALLLISFAWQPGPDAGNAATAVPATIDWEALEFAHVQAVTAAGRSIAVRFNVTDELRLRELQASLPSPFQDRLTGSWNANGMDRLIVAWSDEPELRAYPSSYAMFSLSSADELLEQRGGVCVELAIKSISELLTEWLGDCVIISRYQPNRFILQLFGKSHAQYEESLSAIVAKIAEPDFFHSGEEAIPLECRATCWFCDRNVSPDELIHYLEESDAGNAAVPADPAVTKPTPPVAKPFSIDDLAPFPCPWEDRPEDNPSVPMNSTEEDEDRGGQGAREGQDDRVEHDEQPVLEISDENAEQAGNRSRKKIETVDEFDAREAVADERNIARKNNVESAEPAEGRDRLAFTGSTSAQTLEGFASPEQIEDLLNQLSVVGRPDEEEEEESRRAAPPAISEPEAPPEMPKGRSIYTDDIEESLIKDDLASLFAAVRSSAAGDFGYAGQRDFAAKDDEKESKAPEKESGPEPSAP